MSAGEQKLTIASELKGGEQTAKGLDNIAGSKDRVTESANKGATAAGTATSAQAGLNASDSDYLGILTLISPQLALYIDGIVKSSKVAGDLASKNISLTGITKNLTKAITGNAKAFTLLLAGGATVVGLLAVAFAIKKIWEEAKQAEQALRDLKNAQTDLQSSSIETAADIAAKVDQSRRRQPLTAAQQESITQTIQAAPADIRDKLPDILGSLGGAKGFGSGAGSFTGRELENLARLGFEPNLGRSPQRSTEFAQRFLDRNADRIAGFEQRQAETRPSVIRSAAEEAFTTDPTRGEANLRNLIASKTASFGVDQGDQLAITKEAIRQLLADPDNLNDPNIANRIKLDGRVGLPGDFLTSKVTPIQGLGLQETLKALIPVLRDLANAPRANIVNLQGSTINGADAGSRIMRKVNGETLSQTEAIE